MSAEDSGHAQIERIVRAEHGRLVASLARRFGDLDIAEDATSEALLEAVQRWPVAGFPPNPGAWLSTTANNKAIDRIRRESRRDDKHRAAVMITDDSSAEPTGPVADDQLRLLFICCHPALAPEARVALTLRMLGGLTVGEIARAFLVPETTMAQRITRAKKKIRAAHIPYRVPGASDLPDRLSGVLTVVYLVFNEGYLAGTGEDPIRSALSDEAIRLGRVLRGLLPDEGEVEGLLALMLLIDSRRGARVAHGELVTLDEQDRDLWDGALIREGHSLVRRCLERVAATRERPGPYQLMAAINAVHTDAANAADTDWGQVVALYDQLRAIVPTPVIALNRAIAVAELDGPQVGLALIDTDPLVGYHAWHAARADMLRRLGRRSEAREEYDAAMNATENRAERAFLTRRRDQTGTS